VSFRDSHVGEQDEATMLLTELEITHHVRQLVRHVYGRRNIRAKSLRGKLFRHRLERED
jgi:hypothetical protein